jgi:hypothetical protein
MATGLRPEMFEYRSPGGGGVAESGTGMPGDQIQGLRDQLARLQSGLDQLGTKNQFGAAQQSGQHIAYADGTSMSNAGG